MYCEEWFRAGDDLRRRFSTEPGQFRDKYHHPIPLKYLCKTSNRYFHSRCARLSERAISDDEDEPELAMNDDPSEASEANMQPSHDDEQDAIENLQLLSTRSMNTITSVSPFQHQATTLLDTSVSSHSVRVPSTMRRRSSKYDLFSALSLSIFSLICDFHLIFQAHSPTAADRSVHVPTAPTFTV